MTTLLFDTPLNKKLTDSEAVIAGLQHNDEVNIEGLDRRWRERQSWLTSKTNAYGSARERQPYLKTFSGEHVYKEPQ